MCSAVAQARASDVFSTVFSSELGSLGFDCNSQNNFHHGNVDFPWALTDVLSRVELSISAGTIQGLRAVTIHQQISSWGEAVVSRYRKLILAGPKWFLYLLPIHPQIKQMWLLEDRALGREEKMPSQLLPAPSCSLGHSTRLLSEEL